MTDNIKQYLGEMGENDAQAYCTRLVNLAEVSNENGSTWFKINDEIIAQIDNTMPSTLIVHESKIWQRVQDIISEGLERFTYKPETIYEFNMEDINWLADKVGEIIINSFKKHPQLSYHDIKSTRTDIWHDYKFTTEYLASVKKELSVRVPGVMNSIKATPPKIYYMDGKEFESE